MPEDGWKPCARRRSWGTSPGQDGRGPEADGAASKALRHKRVRFDHARHLALTLARLSAVRCRIPMPPARRRGAPFRAMRPWIGSPRPGSSAQPAGSGGGSRRTTGRLGYRPLSMSLSERPAIIAASLFTSRACKTPCADAANLRPSPARPARPGVRRSGPAGPWRAARRRSRRPREVPGVRRTRIRRSRQGRAA